jgi:copper resistance protein B
MKIIFTSVFFCALSSVALAQHDHSRLADNKPKIAATDEHDEHMMGGGHYGKLLIDKFEVDADESQQWDAQAYYGSDTQKLWLKAEGERSDGATEHAEIQALYSRAISPFFDVQIGVRHDMQPQPSRDWLALGVQGLAPYFFETDITLFVGAEGRSALRLHAEYDVLITQKLILAPELKINVYGENDAETGIGRGLSDTEFGLRLRYELLREFAPYIGVNWTHQFGETAAFTRSAGGDSSDMQWVAGIRMWF